MDLNKLENLKPVEINSYCDEQGKRFAKEIKTNQIRNVFSKIISLRNTFKSRKDYDEKIERDLILLKPLLAYAAGRNEKVKMFQSEMNRIIDGVTHSSDKKLAIENFFAIVEGFVAYHKFHGGKDK